MQQHDLAMELERYNQLQKMFRTDVPVYLKNRKSSLSEVASVQVRENGRSEYMADVITDDDGVVKEIRFDKVTQK